MKKIGKHLRGHAVAYVALFFALGGTSIAAVNALPRNSVGSAQIKNGTIQKVDLARRTVSSLRGLRGLRGLQGAAGPANGGGSDNPLGGNEFLHGQAYGAAVNNNGTADCEIGQRGYQLKQNVNDPQQRPFVSDAYTPGDQGTTWTGRPSVPAGETFSRIAQGGPQLLPSGGN